MIELPLKFLDFDGNEVTQIWGFHMSIAEVTQIMKEMGDAEGFQKKYSDAVAEKNIPMLLDLLKDLAMWSVGKRSEDRTRFLKTDDIRAEFVETGAYDALFFDLTSGDIPAGDFFNGVFPKDFNKNMARLGGKKNASESEQPKEKTWDQYTNEELVALPRDQFKALMVKFKGQNIPQPLLMAAMIRTGDM